MKGLKYCIFLCAAMMLSCAGPKAVFDYRLSDETAPSRLELINKSENAQSYTWYINGRVIGHDPEPALTLEGSGRYRVELEAKNNNHSHIAHQEVFLSAPQKCRVLMETDRGDMVFELTENTPGHLENFISLVQRDYYDSLAFHRIIDNFMIQAGDPASRATTFGGDLPETIPAEISAGNLHFKGALAAARMPDEVNPERLSSATQFYIVEGRPVSEEEMTSFQNIKQNAYAPDASAIYKKKGGTPQLDEAYTVFGYLIQGFDVLDKISSVQTGAADRPVEPVWILDVRIVN